MNVYTLGIYENIKQKNIVLCCVWLRMFLWKPNSVWYEVITSKKKKKKKRPTTLESSHKDIRTITLPISPWSHIAKLVPAFGPP